MEKKNGRVTIKSIANELGISFSTVAKALNNDPCIRQETRELVQNKAKEMNYTRNYFAQGLRQKGSKTVAIILNEIDIPAYGEMISMISASSRPGTDWEASLWSTRTTRLRRGRSRW